MSEILIPIIIVGGMGIVFGILLGVASKIFEVKTDERIPMITETLPGANCGGCGFAGCAAYADAIVNDGAKTNMCPVGGAAVAKRVSEIMGVDNEKSEPVTARVMCSGTLGTAALKFEYDGPPDCHIAAGLGGGEKLCPDACLGFGSCTRVCKFGAISVKDGVAVTDEEKCTGCGMCAAECPKKVIKLVPSKTKYTVACSSREKGKQTRTYCGVGCIGCGICAKSCPKGAIDVKDNLARINYEKCVECGICAQKCPRHIIRPENPLKQTDIKIKSQ